MKILSFDIEEFTLYPKHNLGNIEPLYSLLDRILDLLDEKNIRGTFFCLGEIAREYPDVIKTIAGKGHDIGCHSDKHIWLTELSRTELFDDTRQAIDSIEQVIGKKVISFRAPAFSIGEKNKWALEVLSECGIEVDCSIFPAVRDNGGFSSYPDDNPALLSYGGITMKELPMSITTMLGKKMAYSGGGYFRLLPYGKIRRITGSKDYVMTYFHLHDFNTKEKRKFSPRYFKSYYGVSGAFDKFDRYTNDFDFINVRNAMEIIDWNKVPKITI